MKDAIQLAARLLLPAEEREMLLGDLAEACDWNVRALVAIIGMATRRLAPAWLWALGIALPCSFLLIGFSASISPWYQFRLESATGRYVGQGVTLFLCNAVLLGAWVGSVRPSSALRRATWTCAALSAFPCSFCFLHFDFRLCLLLAMIPAAAALLLGVRATPIRFSASIAFAIAATLLTLPEWSQPGAWLPNWTLSWPAWYLVAITPRRFIHAHQP